MKFCEKACNGLYVGLDGRSSLCGWMNVYTGDLAEQSFEEVFYGKKAQVIRDAMAKGDFRYCNSTSCPCLENNSLLDLSEEEVKSRFDNIQIEYLELAYDRVCNHRDKIIRDLYFNNFIGKIYDYKELNILFSEQR